MGAVASPHGLHMVILPKSSEKAVKKTLEEHYCEDLIRDEKFLSSAREQINDYLAGKRKFFKVQFDASGATPFELKVWDTINGIPYGEVRSYDWVAKQIASPSMVRAVGQALKRNRLPLIFPCHRVINKSGSLGGFSGGAELKRKLLKIEGRIW